MRNILTLLKVVPDIDPALDQAIGSADRGFDLQRIVTDFDRGVLYWSSWLDPWLMGNDLNPKDWTLPLEWTLVGDDLWQVELLAGDWKGLKDSIRRKRQYVEQVWIRWQLYEAFAAYSHLNKTARLLYGRYAMSASLDDNEIVTPK